ncbi:aar2 domain containing protein [Botrytis cinerea]
MANIGEDPLVNDTILNNSSPTTTDESIAETTKIEEPTTRSDPSFIQHQISLQRSPSATKSHVSALSGQLSIKSSGSSPRLGFSSLAIVHSDDGQRRSRGDSNGSNAGEVSKSTLLKSDSHSSGLSINSEKSVHSVNVVGSYPLGTLRVHSPSPTRERGVEHHEILKHGDVVIIRNLPASTIFGYDTKAYTIKTEGTFEGVKQIPAGAHFFWGGSGNGSSRTGFWLMTMKLASDEFGEINVLRWDNYHESLEEELSEAEKRIQKASVPEIANKLEPYLSVSPSPGPVPLFLRRQPSLALQRVTGGKWNSWKVSSSHDIKTTELQTSSAPRDVKGGTTNFDGDEFLNFVFPRSARTFSESSSGRERTEQAIDSTSYIVEAIGRCTYEDSDEIIGELQFCYITGMILGNLACMEQWRIIIIKLFGAYRLSMDHPVFFRKVITAVHAQFMYDEEGFDTSIFDHDSHLGDDLKIILTKFKSRLNEQLLSYGSNITREQEEVGKAFEAFESWLWKWGWDLRGNYLRSGKFQLEDGEMIDAELKDFEDEDERGDLRVASLGRKSDKPKKSKNNRISRSGFSWALSNVS